MTKEHNKQLAFLKHIEDLLPSSSSMPHELADILGISVDSAYRRMRGKTMLTIDEIITLCNTYAISFDSFTNNDNGAITFKYMQVNNDPSTFIDYLGSVKQDLIRIHGAKEKLMVYACKDVPVFHNYNYPELAAFKMFYWMKSIMNVPSLEKAKFDISSITDAYKSKGEEIFNLYKEIPSIEIWTESTIYSIIKQIEFYLESGVFLSKIDALGVCMSFQKQLDDIQKMAEYGCKKGGDSGNYSLYMSDIEITNNCVLVKIGEEKFVYLGHMSFNTMCTTNKNYAEETEEWLNNLIKTSTLISGVSEKHRYRFFKKYSLKVDQLIKRIEQEM